MSNFYSNRVLDKYLAVAPKLVTLRQLCVFGKSITPHKLVASGNYVRQELSVRLAHRIRDFQGLPFVVGTNPHIEQVYSMYWTAFDTFRKFPEIKNVAQNEEFCDTVDMLLTNHLKAIPLLARGMRESGLGNMSNADVDRFMDATLKSRIGRRVIAEQHIALTRSFMAGDEIQSLEVMEQKGRFGRRMRLEHGKGKGNWIGIVNTSVHADDTIDRCYQLAKTVFESTFGRSAPPILMDGHMDATFMYIPDQAEYILYEVMENAMRFTLFHHFEASELPPIRVTVALSPSDVSTMPQTVAFRISDQGGGIPPHILPHVFSFAHPSKFSDFVDVVPTMAGTVHEKAEKDEVHLGIGLPLCRVYTEFWGGEIALRTMWGWGSDVYVRLGLGNRLENIVEWALMNCFIQAIDL